MHFIFALLLLAAHASLPANVYSYTGIDPTTADTADLAPIDRIIGNAAVVALGEGVHTSGGFHDIKSRVIRHLVADKGFRVFTMETPMLTAIPTTNFLRSCARTGKLDTTELANAMKAIFPVFASTSTKELFTWLCNFNIQHPQDAVNFFGFDMQESMQQVDALTSFANTYDANQVSTALNDLSQCADVTANQQTTAATRQTCEAAVDTLLTAFANPATFGTQPSDKTLAMAQLELRDLKAYEEEIYYFHPGSMQESFQPRDQAMADTLQTLRTLWFPQKRTIVWAHDVHIEKLGTADQMNNGPSEGAYPTMGEYLANSLKQDYVTFGLVSYQEDVDWPGAVPNAGPCLEVPANPDTNAIERMLRVLNSPYLIVDTEAMAHDPNALFTPGSRYEYAEGSSAPIGQEYDGLIYIQHSAAMTPLFWQTCPANPEYPAP